jgi:uncharacterized 2Fe-2S/4Fe-4S cluster protein (DUF4445 family)
LLVKTDEVSPIGVLSKQDQVSWRLPIDNEQFFLSKRDLDLFARAKAATSVGIVALCEAADISLEDIDTLYIGGDFGRYLHIDNAISIGLLPQIPSSNIKTLGNTALLGCMDLALSSEAKDEFWKAQNNHEVINLSAYKTFDEVYMQNLYLRPMSFGS